MVSASFDSLRPGADGWRCSFSQPRDVWVARAVADVPGILAAAERAALDGRWVALCVSYEAAPAFDPAFSAHEPVTLPPACAASFDAPAGQSPVAQQSPCSLTQWQPRVPRSQFVDAISRIRSYIAAGDVYQVNYTFPLDCAFSGDAAAWYRDLCAAQEAAYCAFIDLGRLKFLSISPELFLDRRGSSLVMRPMKGTAPRGRWADEDAARSAWLADSAKNRAENLMIVDLVRNDLGRVSDIGLVSVPRLFDIERYPTVFQMTSTVKARQRKGTWLMDIFAAVFPCGSITGAPKIRATEIIRELEPFPRGIYTGAVGLIEPGGDCTFNVAIRTVVVDSDQHTASFGVGGGITWDSDADSEYAECLDKCLFLGQQPSAFSLLESLLLDNGSFFLLDRHLARLKSSALYFGFALDEPLVRRRLAETRDSHSAGQWKVRLMLDRNGTVTINAEPLAALSLPRTVAFAVEPISADTVFLHHKTTRREAYEAAMKSRPGVDDVLLWNNRGEVTESTIANIVIEKDGIRWTPPRSSGLLNGVYRDELLASGEIREKVLTKDDVLHADKRFLINSVRKWMPFVVASP